MNEEIRVIIEKSLPAQVGETLKGVLAKAEKDAKDVEALSVLNKKLADENRDLEVRLREYAVFDERNIVLNKRELDLKNGERDLKIEELKYKLCNEREKTEFAKEVSLGLVRNTEYRRTTFAGTDKIINDVNGYPITHRENNDLNETITTE